MGVNGWSLEVVRGREAGRAFPLVGPETVLGNALAGVAGIDLASQEGDNPRRMAGRQAVVEAKGQGIAVRDLDSPGGTFVNRQRILPGQARTLQPGDLIQVGAVQLRVVESNGKVAPPQPKTQPPPPPPPQTKAQPSATFTFTLKNGSVCRSWDDFLRVASQRWVELRDELTSGRLSAWLTTSGRADLIGASRPEVSPDDRLDAWLGGLPTTLPARPELDVHPTTLVIRVTPGGGTIGRTVQVANLGYRLLRMTAAIEPADAAWVQVAKAFDGPTRTVIDQYDLPLDIHIPASLPRPLSATLKIGGNGGEKRVALVLEAKAAAEAMPTVGSAPTPVGRDPIDLLASVPAKSRLVALGLGGVVLRFAVGLLGGMLGADGMKAAGAATPGLLGPTIGFALVAAIFGAVSIGRRGGPKEAVFGAISGGIAGAGLAAVVVACCRSIEPLLGGWATSPVVAAALWGVLGAALAAASIVAVPPKGSNEVAR
jgi:hypothetical protein